MLLIIEAKAADGFDVFPAKGSKEKAYILIRFNKQQDAMVRGNHVRLSAQSHRVRQIYRL